MFTPMKKSNLIQKIAAKQQSLSLSDVELSIDTLLNYLADALSQKGRVEIRGFGNLTLQYQEPREAHNPRTGEKIQLPGRYKVRFKMGKKLKEEMNSRSD